MLFLLLLNVEFRVNFNVFLLYTYSYATNLRRCLLAEIGARRIGMSIKARRWMKVRFRRKEIMYENEWLRLSRCYFMEYKKLASDIIHKDAQYYLIVDTPEHMKEIESLVKGKVNCSIFASHAYRFNGRLKLIQNMSRYLMFLIMRYIKSTICLIIIHQRTRINLSKHFFMILKIGY